MFLFYLQIIIHTCQTLVNHDTKFEVLRAVSLNTQGFQNATA